ncbi:MAG: Fe-S protein assembly co-chaperone HscB [Lewinellaceae bacterium]|nr:Fe-S protein assembly co-chaperone HscB [Lewinellaceae bacterium]
MNYFEFYQLPIAFRVDEVELKRLFYAKSKQFHPDFHTLSDETEQEKMLEMATLNNEAYKTLSDLDARIRYVLQLKGLLGEEEQAAKLPQDFLMDMMDINEQLMELEFDFDADRYQDTLKSLEALENGLEANVKPILDQYSDPGNSADLEIVKEYFLKKRYLLRIRENLSKFALPNQP